MTELPIDVLVVGAGPTGLMLANQLARRGVRVQIIDRHAGPSLQTRALGVQARTMEIYAKLGIADRALQLGKRGTGATLWAQGRKIGRLPLSERGLDDTPFPYILILGQDDNEKIMGENLNRLGVTVRWNTELVGLEQDRDGATATLKLEDGTSQSLRVPWVAGCDGARSAVRELSGITFPGAPYEHVFFVADVEMTGGMAAEEVNAYLWREGFHLLFPMRGLNHWRIVGILPEELRGKEGVTFDAVIPSLHKEAGAGLDFRNYSWFSTYRIHHRSAARFRDRRCFLLGDAAHIHSPVGAQGMNTGLQDAYNLAWKLALVVNGKAGEALLESYEAERIPVARRLLNTTDRAFKLIVADNWLAGLFRTKILARLAAFALSRKAIQEFAFRTVSQIGINYRKSPISKSLPGLPADAPQVGERFPWLRYRLKADGPPEDLYQKRDDTKFNLIVIGQLLEKPLDFGGLLKVYGIASGPLNAKELARWHLPQTSFYLLRPDGHVGLCGTRLDVGAIKRYLSASLHLII